MTQNVATEWNPRKESRASEAYWAGVSCPYCGLWYRDFKPGLLSYREARDELWRESKRAQERGDYSQRVYHGRVLGRMFEAKQAAWEDHLRWCEEADAEGFEGVRVAGAFGALVEAPPPSFSARRSLAPAPGLPRVWMGVCR